MDNLRGALFMTLAMALFAIEDMLIKLMSDQLSTGQIFLVIGAGGVAGFALLDVWRRDRLWTATLWHPMVLLRTAAEVFGSVGFVTALALTDISSASAILQTVPLFVTLGAALVLGETVGWRRWSAIAVGLVGVLLIIQPGLEAFEPASLFALQGAIGLSLRDLITRQMPPGTTPATMSLVAFAAFVPTGLVMMWAQATLWVAPDPANTMRLAAAIVIGIAAYLTIIRATSTGDVASVAPYRYTRILFALIVGVLVFDENPNTLMLIGTAIVVSSGIYTMIREARTALHPR